MIEVEMSEVWDKLGDDERKTILYLANRLLTGQMQYGKIDLANDKRDWSTERKAEIGDLLVYSAFEALKA